MNRHYEVNICPLCGGKRDAGTTTYSVDIGTGVVVVRNVNAKICTQCGEVWIDNNMAQALEAIVEEARRKRHQVEVVAM